MVGHGEQRTVFVQAQINPGETESPLASMREFYQTFVIITKTSLLRATDGNIGQFPRRAEFWFVRPTISAF